jgi:GTP pyrophosphokinase
MSGTDSPLDEWEGIYDGLHPTFTSFVDKLETLLGELLAEDDVSYAWTYTWAFGTHTVLERAYRARRLGKRVDDPLKLPGFAGVGIVAHNAGRARRIAEIVEREFDVDQEASVLYAEVVAKQIELASPDNARRGERYPFAQYFVSIPDARATLTEWAPYRGLRVNVDIQTLLQYTWERVEHDLPYHWERTYPTEVREQIARYVALIAAADEEYERIWTTIEDLREGYENELARGELDVELNAESLIAYLRVSDAVAALVQVGVDAGLQVDEDEFLPRPSSIEQSLLWVLKQSGIDSIRQLDEFIQSAATRAPHVLRDIARLSSEAGFLPWALPDSIVEWLVLVLRRADSETVSLVRYYDQIEDTVNTLIGNVVRSREAP